MEIEPLSHYRGMTGNGSPRMPLYLAASHGNPGAEDESIRDLRRAIVSQINASDVKRKAETPKELRPVSDLLDPESGRLRDVAQPGGFRRHHVRQVEPSSMNSNYVGTSLIQLLQPELSFFEELGEPEANGDLADCHRVASHNASSNLATIIIIIKCCFGSAFLIVPHGFKTAGYLGGPLCLIFVYINMIIGMLHLIECRRATAGTPRFQDLGIAWGSWGPKYINGAVVLLSQGFNCIWIVTIQENLGMIFPHWSATTRLWCFLPIVALLSLVRKLKLLTFTNFIGILCCSATCLYLCFHALEEIATSGVKQMKRFDTTDADTLLWFGACGYIFELICGILPIYEAAADKDMMPKLLVGGTMGVITLYLSFGMLFYCAFGEGTADLATLNLPKGTFAGKLFPLLFAMVGVVTMPINSFVTSQAYEPSFVWSETYRVRKWKKNAVRFTVVLSSFFLTWLGGSQLQNFLALVGGLLGANLSIIVPACLHLSICKPKGFVFFLDIALCVVGAFMMVLSTYQALMSWK